MPLGNDSLASSHVALQQRPRPLPLFLQIANSEAGGDPAHMARVLAGLERYQQAERLPASLAPPAIAKAGNARLLDYGTAAGGRPVLFVPSLINPPSVLDLGGDKSLLRWLAAQGVRPLLIDWGTPGKDDHGLDIDAHITDRLLPLIDSLGGEPIALVGYCLGGTMAIAAASLRPVTDLVLLATPWHFSGFSNDAKASMTSLWNGARESCEALGVMPMELLQALFWMLDPARTIAKFEQFAELNPASEAARGFVLLEDWANDGPPLTYGAANQLFERFMAADEPGRAKWRIDGVTIDPARLAMPVWDIISTTDRIVPAATATEVGLQRHVASGHVGMIIGSRAREALWQPLADRLRQTAPSHNTAR